MYCWLPWDRILTRSTQYPVSLTSSLHFFILHLTSYFFLPFIYLRKQVNSYKFSHIPDLTSLWGHLTHYSVPWLPVNWDLIVYWFKLFGKNISCVPLIISYQKTENVCSPFCVCVILGLISRFRHSYSYLAIITFFTKISLKVFGSYGWSLPKSIIH